METVLIIYFFIIGLILGSFFNVVGLRVPEGNFFQSQRSYCPHCNHTLTWYELLPVISYLCLKGKCRYCRKNISSLYSIVELFTGVFFAYSYASFGLQLELVVALLLISLTAVIFVTDIKYMLIPNRVLLFFFPLFLLMRLVVPLDPWWSSFAGGVTGIVLLYVIIVISRGGMGGGDMKLFGLLGLVLGVKKVLLAFFLSTISGAIIGGILLALKLVKRGKPIPFGPFIIIGALISYFSGDIIIHWYIELFFI